ncbi:LuxR C-terminal-related transcriptional regulator [Saccharopolyspora sp. NPDC000359]|uniref:response regulator transcription factor n=1 Tax=Saccharopolyspora sp. NPDC000359 TaxID=3154251 RepID=UPI0033288BC1
MVEQDSDGGGAAPRVWCSELKRTALLSPREIQVFIQLGNGKSNRAISLKLQITERTVKAHVARIMAKLGVESRLQAGLVSYAYQLSVLQQMPNHGACARPVCAQSTQRAVRRLDGK